MAGASWWGAAGRFGRGEGVRGEPGVVPRLSWGAASDAQVVRASVIDRADGQRDAFSTLRGGGAEPGDRVLIMCGSRVLAKSDGSGLALCEVEEAEALAAHGVELELLLGRDARGRIVLWQLDELAAEPRGARAVEVRSLSGALDAHDLELLTTALGMANWHGVTGHSPLTGERLRPDRAGWTLVEEQGRAHFPRTDAAVIVAVTDTEDRLLLAANAAWAPRRHSLVAGFVEPGETFEQAAAREVLEETGLSIAFPQYLGNQPWPFPASIMVGFAARLDEERTLPDAVRVDGIEIVHAEFVERTRVRRALAGDPEETLRLPAPGSIAHEIIRAWAGEARS